MTMRSLRTFTADVLDEAARGRRASSRSSAAIGRILKHLGYAKLLTRVAAWIRPEEEDD